MESSKSVKHIGKKPLCISEAIIEISEGILLLKRSDANDLYVNKWQLPGGKSEACETPLDTIKRELFEETGCVCSSFKFIKQVSFSPVFRGKKTNVLLSVYSCSIDGNVKMSGDHCEVAFIPKNEIIPSSLTPISKKALFGYSKRH